MATFVWLSNISCANCGSSAWNVRSHWGNTSDPDVKNCAQDPLLTWLTQQDTESMLFSNSLGTCRSILSFTWLTTAEDVILPKCCWNDSALDKESSSNSKLTERLTREGSVTFRYSTETCRLRNTSSSSILARPNPKNSEQAAPSSVPAFQEQIGLKSKVIRQPRAYEVLSTPLRSLVVIPAMLVVDPFVSESEISSSASALSSSFHIVTKNTMIMMPARARKKIKSRMAQVNHQDLPVRIGCFDPVFSLCEAGASRVGLGLSGSGSSMTIFPWPPGPKSPRVVSTSPCSTCCEASFNSFIVFIGFLKPMRSPGTSWQRSLMAMSSLMA